MRVMIHHKWFDDNVKYVEWSGHKDNREIGINSDNEGTIIINKKDVIALAKEFDLIIYEKNSSL
jgi:hypothetical protein